MMEEKDTQPEEVKQMEEDVLEAKAEIQAFPKGDLVLVVEGKELYVNRDILMEASPVFRAMLESDFKERTQDRIELPGKSYEGMVEFLKCTYTFINSFITVNNVFKILPLAEEYQTSLKKKCEDFMKNVLRGKKSYFIYRTDVFENKQHGCRENNSYDKKSLIIKYHSDMLNPSTTNTYPSRTPTTSVRFTFGTTVAASPSQIVTKERPDASTVDDFSTIGFGRNGFEVGNTVPADIVIEYILEAEKYGCNEFLKIAIQYVAMRQFSHFESARGFSDISLDTRFKITTLRLRILENYESNGLEINDLLSRK